MGLLVTLTLVWEAGVGDLDLRWVFVVEDEFGLLDLVSPERSA